MATAKQLWLIVEDDNDDFFLFERACSSTLNGDCEIHREMDGFCAVNYLEGCDNPPSLIVSDLKMPHMDGFQLLSWVRSQSRFRQIRFVMLSSSNAEQDIAHARMLGVDDYRVKPTGLKRLVEVVGALHRAHNRPHTDSVEDLVQQLSRVGSDLRRAIAESRAAIQDSETTLALYRRQHELYNRQVVSSLRQKLASLGLLRRVRGPAAIAALRSAVVPPLQASPAWTPV